MDNELTNKINLIGTEKQIKYAIDIIEGAISMGQRFKLKPLQEKYERVKNLGTEKYTAEKNAKTLAKIQKHIDAVNAGLNFLRNTLTSGYHAKNIIENQDWLFSQDIFESEITEFYTLREYTQQKLFEELTELLEGKYT